MSELAFENNQAILILHHLDKTGSNLMGSSVLFNSPRLIYKLEFESDKKKNSSCRKVEILKDSNQINSDGYAEKIQIFSYSDFELEIDDAEMIKKQDIAPVSSKEIEGVVTMQENRGFFI